MRKSYKIILHLFIVLIVLTTIVLSSDHENSYDDALLENKDFTLESGDSLAAADLQGFTGTANLGPGTSAVMPPNFQGTLALTNAKVTMPGGRVVTGTGTCDSTGCSITQGESGSGSTKVHNGAFHVTNDGIINIEGSATIGEGDTATQVSNVQIVKFENDGTYLANVEEGSVLAGVTVGSAGSIVFDPKSNTVTPSVREGDVFIIQKIDYTLSPVTLQRDTVDIQVGEGMYLTSGFTQIVLDGDGCSGNCLAITDTTLQLKGDGYTIRFNEHNPVVNIYNANKLRAEYERRRNEFFTKYNIPEKERDQFNFLPVEYPNRKTLKVPEAELEFEWNEIKKLQRVLPSPRILEVALTGGVVNIENRNVYDSHSIQGIDPKLSQAARITITGDSSDESWADILTGSTLLRTGNNGIGNSRRAGRGLQHSAISLELNVVDDNGKSVIRGKGGEEIKVSVNTFGGVTFSSTDARVNAIGFPSCGFGADQNPGCRDDYFRYSQEFTSQLALKTAQDQYENNKERKHDFRPEYDQNLDSISLFLSDDGEGIAETQLEILQQLPDYTSIKLFVSSEDRQSYLQKTLPPGLYDRITFVKVPKGHRFSPWAQDYSEGDNSVQILPLTYLGGGSRRNPGKPENDLVYQYEGEGLEVRRVPVEFAGGNVYVTRNKAGRKILLVGGDSYLATERSYTKLGETITEERYREVMRTTFNVDEVEIIATRDAANKIQPQSRSIFHIDQMMIPLDDGVVAIPDVEVTPPTLTKEEVVEQENEEYTRLAAKYGLSKKKGTWIDTSSLSPEEKKRFREDQRKVRERHQDFRREIRFYEDSVEVKRQIDHHRSNLEQRGFDVVPLKSDSQSVGRFQAYTNGIVYKDRNTGQRTVIMPIFPNKQGEYTLEGINLENKEAYERAGYKVKTVRDKAFKQSGNIHCLTILAQAPKTCPECNLRVG